jgi:hypothetical protein
MRLNWIGRPTSSVFGQRQLVAARLDQVGELVDQRRALAGLTFGHEPSNAPRAAATAASTSACPALATSASFSPVDGSSVAKRLAARRLAPLAADQHLADLALPALAKGLHAVFDRGLDGHESLSTACCRRCAVA